MGTSYRFAYRVQNVHGWSTWSDIVEILAATEPGQMQLVTISDNTDETVQISWSLPVENGASVTAYRIYIYDVNSAFYYETSICDGSDATIVANRYCNVPMSTLTALPYVLIQGSLVKAII